MKQNYVNKELSNRLEAQFKLMVLKMLTRLEIMDDLKEDFNRESHYKMN